MAQGSADVENLKSHVLALPAGHRMTAHPVSLSPLRLFVALWKVLRMGLQGLETELLYVLKLAVALCKVSHQLLVPPAVFARGCKTLSSEPSHDTWGH